MKTQNRSAKSPLRLIGDKSADRAFLWMQRHEEAEALINSLHTNQDLDRLRHNYSDLSELVSTMSLPHWSDPSLLRRASQFFTTHATDILTMLGLYSLPYCYAGANGVKVLYHSSRIKEEPAKRLTETAQFVLDVCEPDSFSQEGKALVALLKVRLMHATARFYARRLIVDEEPVNQEDMLGTLLAFSLIVIRGMRKTGISISSGEAEAFFHLWRVVGVLLGIEETHLPHTLRQASVLERQIRRREFRYSHEAKELTASLLKYIEQQSPKVPGFKPADMMGYLLGAEVSSCLGLKNVSVPAQTLVEVSGRTRNTFKTYSDKNYALVVNQLNRNRAGHSVPLR